MKQEHIGAKPVPAPEKPSLEEPDWDDCIHQAEVATGLKVERNTLSIVIREVRRWLAQRQILAEFKEVTGVRRNGRPLLVRRGPPKEPCLSAYGWRLLLGPAGLADGLIETLSLSLLTAGVKLEVSRRLAKARILAK